jgi:copper transport protein
VLILTAVLVNVVPAKTAAGNGLLSLQAKIGSGTVEVVVDPTGGGRLDLHVYLLDARGRPDSRYIDAAFAFSLPAQNIGPLERKPIRPSPGHFQVLGLRLAPPGTWSLTITVKVDKFNEEEATLTSRFASAARSARR